MEHSEFDWLGSTVMELDKVKQRKRSYGMLKNSKFIQICYLYIGLHISVSYFTCFPCAFNML
jgi:hypothetical protein